MDSNGARFLLLNSAEDFAGESTDCGWDARLDAFALARRDTPRLPALPAAEALAAWAAARPLVQDGHGQYGRLSPDGLRFEYALRWPCAETDWQPVLASAPEGVTRAKSANELSLDPVDPPPGAVFIELALGGDGLAALAWSNGADRHGLTLVHLRQRWQVQLPLPFAPVRLAVDADQHVWVTGDADLALCRGRPLPQEYNAQPDRFEPAQANPDPPRLLWRTALSGLDGVLGLATDAEYVYLLARQGATGQSILCRSRSERADAVMQTYPVDAALPFATDLAGNGSRLFLLAPLDAAAEQDSRCDCAVALLHDGDAPAALRVEERWPMLSLASPRFVGGLDGQVRYLARDRARALHPLAQARFVQAGEAVLSEGLDAGQPDTCWHKLNLTVRIPPGCALTIACRAADDFDALQALPWEEQPEPLPLPSPAGEGGVCGTPTGAPVPMPHEILLQRANGRVRQIRGRYLQLRLRLSGDGRATPALHALRAWYPRFSWQEAYLPQHFHQQERPAEITPAAPEAANAADLRERLLATLESLLTPIEDRIAASETLLYPESMPVQRLDALAASLGGRLPAHWPEARRRTWLKYLGLMQRHRGLHSGLCLALDIATDGGVSRGQVVPVENFRLRRTLGTVLGIDLSDDAHPLTLGTAQSGNSIVGDSLILTDDDAREFLALFAPELAQSQQDRRAVADLFDRYARRITVVLHGPARAQRRAIEQVLPEQIPAHCQWVIRETEHPFVLGLSPLLGIDTYLQREPGFRRVTLNRTRLGRGDLLINPTALAPEHAAPGRGEGRV
ncbi:MAG: hypothetical protein HZB71_01830 [Betaproteobacteria bacterium]|nr:hypothetical protein [Betaproteobacteria bacterium]